MPVIHCLCQPDKHAVASSCLQHSFLHLQFFCEQTERLSKDWKWFRFYNAHLTTWSPNPESKIWRKYLACRRFRKKKKNLAYRFGRQTWEAYLQCTSTHCIKQPYQGYNNQPVPQLEEPFSDQQTHQHRDRWRSLQERSLLSTQQNLSRYVSGFSAGSCINGKEVLCCQLKIRRYFHWVGKIREHLALHYSQKGRSKPHQPLTCNSLAIILVLTDMFTFIQKHSVKILKFLILSWQQRMLSLKTDATEPLWDHMQHTLSLVSRPPSFFVLWFAFSTCIIHGSGRAIFHALPLLWERC